jgi:hypothetical protein
MLPDIIAKNGFSLERIAALCAVMDAGTIAGSAGLGRADSVGSVVMARSASATPSSFAWHA